MLGLVYGLGYLCFAWWDGGVLRRLLMGAMFLVAGYAAAVFLHDHHIAF